MAGDPTRTRPARALERPVAADGAAARLVCFPHAGGGPTGFRRWARELAPAVELWHVTLPGRAAREHEPFARDWPPLVDQLADEIGADVPAPVALWGHSLGALLGFEVGRVLSARGTPPVHLFASARNAPDPAWSFEVPAGDDALVRDMDARYGGIPDVVRAEPELMRYFLRFLRADLELLSAYRYVSGERLACPITVLAGDADPTVDGAGLERWRELTTGAVELRRLRGGHFFLDEREDEVLAALRSKLAG